jgi:hypothetical protein
VGSWREKHLRAEKTKELDSFRAEADRVLKEAKP